MSNNRMTNKQNILESPKLKESPFRMPEGYLEALEASVGERISKEERSGLSAVLRPAIALVFTFALIFGMGYGVLSLTDTLNKHESKEDILLVEQGWIKSNFVDHFDMDEDEEAETDSLDEEEIIDYLSGQLSIVEISELYAQVQ